MAMLKKQMVHLYTSLASLGQLGQGDVELLVSVVDPPLPQDAVCVMV